MDYSRLELIQATRAKIDRLQANHDNDPQIDELVAIVDALLTLIATD